MLQAATTPPAVVRPVEPPVRAVDLPVSWRAMLSAHLLCTSMAKQAKSVAEFDRAVAGMRRDLHESPQLKDGTVELEDAGPGICRLRYRGSLPVRLAYSLRRSLTTPPCTQPTDRDPSFHCSGGAGGRFDVRAGIIGSGADAGVASQTIFVSPSANASGIHFLPNGFPDLSWP